MKIIVNMDPWLELFGLIAGAVTSFGFIPQLIKGYKTKKLEDVSYYMPLILAIGMGLWIIYGILIEAFAVIAANIFAMSCCVILILMKKKYSK
jgi:MtN3 and saliva related transmembrane protein